MVMVVIKMVVVEIILVVGGDGLWSPPHWFILAIIVTLILSLCSVVMVVITVISGNGKYSQ